MQTLSEEGDFETAARKETKREAKQQGKRGKRSLGKGSSTYRN
jgi:hypothetical protein